MGKKILVIDDDRVALVLLENRLSKAGYEVAVARDGREGLVQAARIRPELIILDIEMPEMNGYTFILEMRKIEGLEGTPVIVQTSHEENKPIFARRGIFNYFVKPVNVDDLLKKVADLIGPA